MTNNEDQRSAELMTAVDPAPPRQPAAARLEAALIDAARAIAAVEARPPEQLPELSALLARARALHARARAAAARRTYLVAYDCLEQIERELVGAMDEAARAATFAVYLAEARARLADWRRAAAQALAEVASGATVSVPALQALMKTVHEARQERRYAEDIVQRQVPLLTGLLIGAVTFFTVWALAGGFDWLTNDQVEVTLAMVLVTGVLLGFIGALLSVALGAMRARAAADTATLRGRGSITVARAFVGAAVAVPIVLLLQSGLVNLGSATPALALFLCFVGGFSERRLLARLEAMRATSTDAAA
jgi:hypothetical protein